MTEREPKMTAETLALLATMLEDPTRPWYGLELAAALSLKTGTVYPTLARLERADWLESSWERVDPAQEGRPRRRLYQMTGKGQERSRRALERHLAAIRVTRFAMPGGKVQPA